MCFPERPQSNTPVITCNQVRRLITSSSRTQMRHPALRPHTDRAGVGWPAGTILHLRRRRDRDVARWLAPRLAGDRMTARVPAVVVPAPGDVTPTSSRCLEPPNQATRTWTLVRRLLRNNPGQHGCAPPTLKLHLTELRIPQRIDPDRLMTLTDDFHDARGIAWELQVNSTSAENYVLLAHDIQPVPTCPISYTNSRSCRFSSSVFSGGFTLARESPLRTK